MSMVMEVKDGVMTIQYHHSHLETMVMSSPIESVCALLKPLNQKLLTALQTQVLHTRKEFRRQQPRKK